MSDQEQVERVARAILMATQGEVNAEYAWSVQFEEVQDELLAQARAAIAAMDPAPQQATNIEAAVEAVIERAFERICEEEPLSPVTRADIRKWVELLSGAGLHPTPAPALAEAKAEALRRAADAIEAMQTFASHDQNAIRRDDAGWLRARADSIDKAGE